MSSLVSISRVRPRDATERAPARSSSKLDRDGELFLIAYLDGYLFYAPRLDTVALIDATLAAVLREQVAAVGLESAALGALAERLDFPASWRQLASVSRPRKEWQPTTVIFSNTQKCTLRCRYCYADGGRLDDTDIDPVIAEAAIELITENAGLLQRRPEVIFLGEGEATANWEGFTYIVDHFRSRCAALSLEPFVQLSTSGVFSANKVSYIARNCQSLTFSIDGTAAAHDAHRVLPNGNGSFALIAARLREFDALGKSYAIWMTATRSSTSLLAEFVQWIGEQTRCKELHVDPVFNMNGLARTAEHTEHVDGREFVDAFRRARKVAASFGISLIYSPAEVGARTAFCGAADASNFLVTSKGIVTSCNEVLRADDPRAALFQYGRWNATQMAFELDSAAIEKLSKLNVREISKCQGCFAKYNCAGDCYARSSGSGLDPWAGDYTARCSITRELLKDNLALSLLRGDAGTPARVTREPAPVAASEKGAESTWTEAATICE